MRDPVYTAELDNDRGELTDKMIDSALDDLIYRLFDGQKVGRLTLRNFLIEQVDIDELAYRMITGSDVRAEIEGRLREYLEGTDALIDHANDLQDSEE